MDSELEDFFENAPCGYHVLDSSGVYARVNRTELEWLGHARDEVLGQPFTRFLSPDSARVYDEWIDQSQAGGPSSIDLAMVREDGTTLWVLLNEATVGGLRRGTLHDLTDRKRLEHQLLQSQKLEVMGQLAGGIAHDFNNLLVVISGYADLLQLELKPADPLRSCVDQIAQAGRRAAALTRQLLGFSRQQILEPVLVDVNDSIAGLEKMLRRLIGEDIALTTRLANDLPRVLVDPGQIEQVLTNLVVNARDAMPLGGTLEVATSAVEIAREPGPMRSGIKPGSYVRIAVRDSGCGMDEATKARVFEPFFTTKAPNQGTGLGLSIAYGIVRQSAGYIEVESSPGEGATFLIHLPVAPAVPVSATPGEVRRVDPRGRETILLVEDEEIVRALISRYLRMKGYTVVEARDGEEAIAASDQHPEPIDLLLTDVIMPRLGGRELAERLRRKMPGLRVLFMSGYTERGTQALGPLWSPATFIQKPCAMDDLGSKIQEVLERPPPQIPS